jgi:hypothetical protein
VAIVLTGLAGCYLVPREPPGGDYKRVSELVRFPDFYPGLGRLYVQPNTLPLGPFRAYDRQGFLVSTIYMVPIKDLEMLDQEEVHILARQDITSIADLAGKKVNFDLRDSRSFITGSVLFRALKINV